MITNDNNMEARREMGVDTELGRPVRDRPLMEFRNAADFGQDGGHAVQFQAGHHRGKLRTQDGWRQCPGIHRFDDRFSVFGRFGAAVAGDYEFELSQNGGAPSNAVDGTFPFFSSRFTAGRWCTWTMQPPPRSPGQ